MDKTDIPRYHYLVLDDDKITTGLISHVLRKHGATRIDIAHDGKVAVERITSTHAFPDIIFCDLNMPDMDGIEFMQYLADEQFTGGIVLVSGTAQNLLGGVRRLGQAHFLNVLGTVTKPFTAEQLLACLTKYDDTRRTASRQGDITGS